MPLRSESSERAARAWTSFRWSRCPALKAVNRPDSGRPIRARSPARSRSLCRTNSSGKRSGGFTTRTSSRMTVFSVEAPRARPWRRRDSTSERNPNVRAGAISRANSLGVQHQPEALRSNSRMGIFDRIGQPHAAGPLHGLGNDRSIAVANDNRRCDPERNRGPVEVPRPRVLESFDERPGAAVQDRHFLGVKLDDQALDAEREKRRECMFDGPNLEPFGDERRAVAGFDPVKRDRRFGTSQVRPAEENPARVRRPKDQADSLAGMDPDAGESDVTGDRPLMNHGALGILP